jgi:hypothetical protein
LILLLNVFQSVLERNPLADDVACARVKTPVRLLYESGHTAESAVSPILVATVDMSDERVPERDVTVPERVETVVFVVESDPERVEIFVTAVARLEERIFAIPVNVAMFVSA